MASNSAQVSSMRSPPVVASAALGEGERVLGGSELGEHRLEELLLALDAAEVRGGVRLLLAVDHLDEWRARTNASACGPSRWLGPASLMSRPELRSNAGCSKSIVIPPRESTSRAKLTKSTSM